MYVREYYSLSSSDIQPAIMYVREYYSLWSSDIQPAIIYVREYYSLSSIVIYNRPSCIYVRVFVYIRVTDNPFLSSHLGIPFENLILSKCISSFSPFAVFLAVILSSILLLNLLRQYLVNLRSAFLVFPSSIQCMAINENSLLQMALIDVMCYTVRDID